MGVQNSGSPGARRLRGEPLYRRPTYLALDVHVARAYHWVAFAVHDGRHCGATLAPRLSGSLGLKVGEAPIGAVWGDTGLLWPTRIPRPDARDDAISGRRHRSDRDTWSVAELLRDFPVAALGGVIGRAA